MVEDVRAETIAAINAGVSVTVEAERKRRVDDPLNEEPISEIGDPKRRILRLLGMGAA